MDKVLITGGTGLIGRYLSERLNQKNYEVVLLTRKMYPELNFKQFLWDPYKNYIDYEAVENVKYIIHLAGENISEKRWTKKRKDEIIKSRVSSIQLLYRACEENNSWPTSIVSSSAIGYYGTFNSEKVSSEQDEAGQDFLAKVCKEWENAVSVFTKKGIRSVILRTGVVLDNKYGAYAKIRNTVKWGIGAPLGTGKQYIPWIHIEDIVSIYTKALENNELRGIYNAVAPEHITNKDFTIQLARSIKRRILLPHIPSILMKIIYGEMSSILLEGSRVSSKKIIEQGFEFRYPTIEKAFNDLANVKNERSQVQ